MKTIIKTSLFILVKTQNNKAGDGCKTTGGSGNVKRNNIIIEQYIYKTDRAN